MISDECYYAYTIAILWNIQHYYANIMRENWYIFENEKGYYNKLIFNLIVSDILILIWEQNTIQTDIKTEYIC